jgi:4-amino-4-deoxy-L-arabinose transferase-like glycosyltransferase
MILKKLPENIGWTFAFLLVLLAWLFGLFIDLTGDSGLYAAISRQMVESGDWFNLKINGEPYDQKPHLFFWLAGLGIQLFGNHIFAFKLFPFIYGTSGIYFTYRLGRQLFSEEAGKWAALIAGTSQIYFLYFLDYHTDSVLQTGVILSLWQLAAYLQHKKPVNFVFGFLGAGLAMLSKGPVGAILPFLAVLIYLVFQKDFKELIHPKWFLGILISLCVISPTLVHLYQSFGPEGIKFFFITNNFGRITGSYAGSSNDYFFYLYNALWAFLPWTVFVVFALFSEIKSWFKPVKKDIWGICLLGSVLILVFILSIARGKAPNYFLIAVSPIAVITAKWLANIKYLSQAKGNILFRFHIFLLTSLVIILLSVIIFLSVQKIWIFVLLLIPASQVLFGGLKKSGFKNLLLQTTVIAGLLNLLLNVSVVPGLFEYQGARQVVNVFEANKTPHSQLYNFDLEEYELFFYPKNPVLQIENWGHFYEIMEKPGSWIYTTEIKYNDILKMDFEIDTVYQIKQQGMNHLNFDFLNPKTRESSLKANYLVVTGRKEE